MSPRKLLVSPYGATIFPIFLLIVAFLFPPTVYSYYVKEPNYMFLNLKMLSFGLLCTFFYYIGLFISNFKSGLRFNFSMLKKIRVSNFTYIGMIALLTIILQIIYFILLAIYLFKASGLGLFNVLFTGRGEIFKYAFRELRIPFGLGAIPIFIVGFEFWLLYKIYELKNSTLINTFMNKKYRLLKFFIILSVILCILENMIAVNRSVLIILVMGWFVIYLYFNKDKVLPNLIKIFLFIIGIFVLTSIIRWGYSANITDMVIEKFLGYTIADFNRMSLMIDGKLSYVDAGIPGILYIFPVFKIPLTQIIFFDLLELSYLSLSAVANAGLNGSYNMATLFGAIYQVIGIMTPIYFFFLGYIGSRLFQAFKKEKNFGVVLYPLFYVSVALWMADVNFFIMNFLYHFYAVIALVVYTSLFKVNRAK